MSFFHMVVNSTHVQSQIGTIIIVIEVSEALINMPRFNRQSQCEKCGVERSSMTSRKFKEHYDLHLDLQFNCDDCEKVFPTKPKLVDHKRYVHSLLINCDVCNKTFTNEKNLKDIS